MKFMGRVRVRTLSELSIAIMAIHQDLPNLMFTFTKAMSLDVDGETYSDYLFYCVSEITTGLVAQVLRNQTEAALSRAGFSFKA